MASNAYQNSYERRLASGVKCSPDLSAAAVRAAYEAGIAVGMARAAQAMLAHMPSR